MKQSILFVCLGNICRSPTAEAIFHTLLKERGLVELFDIDSAGTGDWHIGQPPDQRAQKAAKLRGYDISALRGRQVTTEDFNRFDYILAMDFENLKNLQTMRPEGSKADVQMFLSFAPSLKESCVPDPYYGNGSGFDTVIDMLEVASQCFLTKLNK